MKGTEKSYIIPHKLLTPSDVAELLQISEKTVYKNREKLCGFKPVGLGILRFRKEIIYGIMEGQDSEALVLQFPVSTPVLCGERLQDQKRGSNSQRRKKKRGEKSSNKNQHDLYSLNIREASKVFGFAPQTLYNWINNGRLIRGVHYLKVARKPLIKRKEFIQWMKEQDGSR